MGNLPSPVMKVLQLLINLFKNPRFQVGAWISSVFASIFLTDRAARKSERKKAEKDSAKQKKVILKQRREIEEIKSIIEVGIAEAEEELDDRSKAKK